MFNNSILRLKTEQREEEDSKLFCTFTSTKPKPVLGDKVVRGKHRVWAPVWKTGWTGSWSCSWEYKESDETCFASSKAGWKPAQAAVFSANESQVAGTTQPPSCGFNYNWTKLWSLKKQDSSLSSFYSYDARSTKINLWLFGYSHFPH